MNKNKVIEYQVRFWQWYRLRKKTVLAHWIYGLLCAYIAMKYFPASLAMMGLFGGFERWNDKCSGSKEGAMDFWDGLLTYTVGFGVVLVLEGIGLLSIRWI
jgi:hypothetical protein